MQTSRDVKNQGNMIPPKGDNVDRTLEIKAEESNKLEMKEEKRQLIPQKEVHKRLLSTTIHQQVE